MHLLRLLLLVFGLAHLRGCFTPLCDAVRGYETKVVHTRTGDKVLTAAALTKEGLIVDMAMSYLPPEYHHSVVRMDETYGAQEVAKFKLTDYFGSGVVASGGSWWHSVAGGRDAKSWGVFFVTPEVTFVETPGVVTGDWIPFDEPKPHGLLFGARRGELTAIEITHGDVRREWPLAFDNVWGYGLRDAEPLPGGDIALVSYQQGVGPASGLPSSPPPEAGQRPALHGTRGGLLLLHVLGEGEPSEVVLRENLSNVAVTTAVGANGMLAVVLESKLGELEAAVFDPRDPGPLRWQLLNSKDVPGRNVRVVADGETFIAAWAAPEANELRARRYTATRPGPLAIIAPLLRRGNRAPSIEIIPDGEEILFVWQEDEVMSRRVPAELAGFSFFERLCALF